MLRSAQVALCLGLVCAAGASRAGEPRETRFGALVLRWDADVWSVVERSDGFEASCLARTCKDRTVVAEVTTGGACDRPDSERRPGLLESTLESGPLRWRVATWWRGCRNAHPRSVAACAVHAGRTNRGSAPLLTCRTGPGSGAESEIRSLVRGIGP